MQVFTTYKEQKGKHQVNRGLLLRRYPAYDPITYDTYLSLVILAG